MEMHHHMQLQRTVISARVPRSGGKSTLIMLVMPLVLMMNP
jgi:hypothetical protein